MLKSSTHQEIRPLLLLATPLIFSLLAQISQDVIDTVMMGHLGVQSLAAGGLSWGGFILLLVFFIGIINAIGIDISQAIGAKRHKEIRTILHQGIYLCLLLIPLFMLSVWLLPTFFAATHQAATIVDLSSQFLHYVVWGVPAIIGFLFLREFVAPMQHPRIIMWVSIASIPLNIIFNYILMYGKLGLSAMHMAGIGLASAIVLWLNFFCVLIYVYKQPTLKQHLFGRFQAFNHVKIAQLLKVGWPIGITLIFEDGLFSVTGFLMGYVSVEALAAYQIVMLCYSISFMVVLGLGQAAGIRVAYYVGSHNPNAIKQVVILSIGLSLLIAAIFISVFLSVPTTLADIFIDIHLKNHDTVLNFAKLFFLFAVILTFFDGFQIITNCALRGMKDTLIPMFCGLSSYWLIGLGSGALLTFYMGYASTGLWIGLILGIIVSSIILLLRFAYKLARIS